MSYHTARQAASQASSFRPVFWQNTTTIRPFQTTTITSLKTSTKTTTPTTTTTTEQPTTEELTTEESTTIEELTTMEETTTTTPDRNDGFTLIKILISVINWLLSLFGINFNFKYEMD